MIETKTGTINGTGSISSVILQATGTYTMTLNYKTKQMIFNMQATLKNISQHSIGKSSEMTGYLLKKTGGILVGIDGKTYLYDIFLEKDLGPNESINVSGSNVYNFLDDGTFGTPSVKLIIDPVGIELGEIKISNGHIKINSIWKDAFAWIKTTLGWRRCIVWKKINGIWKRGI